MSRLKYYSGSRLKYPMGSRLKYYGGGGEEDARWEDLFRFVSGAAVINFFVVKQAISAVEDPPGSGLYPLTGPYLWSSHGSVSLTFDVFPRNGLRDLLYAFLLPSALFAAGSPVSVFNVSGFSDDDTDASHPGWETQAETEVDEQTQYQITLPWTNTGPFSGPANHASASAVDGVMTLDFSQDDPETFTGGDIALLSGAGYQGYTPLDAVNDPSMVPPAIPPSGLVGFASPGDNPFMCAAGVFPDAGPDFTDATADNIIGGTYWHTVVAQIESFQLILEENSDGII